MHCQVPEAIDNVQVFNVKKDPEEKLNMVSGFAIVISHVEGAEQPKVDS